MGRSCLARGLIGKINHLYVQEEAELDDAVDGDEDHDGPARREADGVLVSGGEQVERQVHAKDIDASDGAVA